LIAMTSSKKPVYSISEWEARLDQISVSKQDLNRMIMNYLIVEGYQEAASKFVQEANVKVPVDHSHIYERAQIRNSIYQGNIQHAIHRINELEPELLDTNPALHFTLLRLHLIELIRQSASSSSKDIFTALTFATSQLAPRAPENPKFVADLERTMALICFPLNNLPPQLKDLIDLDFRKEVATQVNQALLETQECVKEARIRTLVKLWSWGENKLKQNKVGFPGLNILTGDFVKSE